MLLPLPVRSFSAFLLSKFPLVPKNHFLPWADLPPAPPHSLLPQSISQSEASVHPLFSCQDLTIVPQSARFAGRTTGRRADSQSGAPRHLQSQYTLVSRRTKAVFQARLHHGALPCSFFLKVPLCLRLARGFPTFRSQLRCRPTMPTC